MVKDLCWKIYDQVLFYIYDGCKVYINIGVVIVNRDSGIIGGFIGEWSGIYWLVY